MIQKGIIAQVIDKYTYKIRIPKYDKIEAATASTKTDDLSQGIVCAMPGVDVSYVPGDIVLVSFENDELSKPIILGLLYREQKTDSDISLTNVDNSLSDIQNNLQKINSSGLYTHIRYSNDNGLTFTSLFSDSNHETIIDGEVVCQPLYDDTEVNGIKIDKATRVISWSIIDSNNADATDEIGIEITVFDSNGNIIKKERNTDHQRSFTINNSSKITGDLYFTYKLYVTKQYLDTLSVMITTDKAPFGVPTGEYVGVYVSNNSRASINPSDYSWFQSSAGGDIDIEINNKIARLSAEFDAKLDNLKDEVDENFVTIYYKSVEWTQAEVDVYCQTGYEGIWSRDITGYTGEVKTGNVLYITVHNTGTSSSSTDDSYGQLEIRALADAAAGESVQGVVLSYLVSAEIALDALARFKSSLLEPGDETLVYGGHITTGRISDSSGKNFIQLSAENGTPAGQMEFKDQTSWALSNQGIQWDSGNGQLNVKGNIQANSLTIIGNNGQAYNGNDAINISGYELTLEVVDIDGTYCYVYPHLFLNGDEVTDILPASLPLDTINKIYYTRSGSAPHYDYTVVPDPVDSSISSYYESTIDYSRFIWYRNNSSIGEVGDNTHEGRIRAAYIDTLRCTYAFAEGGTGGAQSAVTVEVDPSRYITRNSATDITVHPETYQNASSYLQLNNNGLNVFDSNGDSIAQYGSTARVGKNNSSRFLINSGSLQAYDSNNVKYFEVTNGGLTWGSNTAATTAQLADKADISDIPTDVSDLNNDTGFVTSASLPTNVSDLTNDTGFITSSSLPTDVSDLTNDSGYQTSTQVDSAIGTAVNGLSSSIADAAKTATNYITYIDSTNGVKVHDAANSTSYAKVNSSGLEVMVESSISVAKFGATCRIGELASKTPHIQMNNRFMQINNNEKSYFGAGFVNQSASVIRIPYEAKYCSGTTTKTITTSCTISSINEIRGYTEFLKVIPLVPNLTYTFTPGTNTITLMNLDDFFIDTNYEFEIDYNTAQFSSLSGNYAPILNEYNSFFGNTYYPEHTISGVISAKVDGDETPTITYTLNQDGSITFDSTVGTNDSHFIYISYVTSDTLFAITGEDQTGAVGVNSVSFGKSNTVSGGYSAAIGKGLTTVSNNQVAVGKYNRCQADSLFMVGNGDEPSGIEMCLTLTNASNHPVLKIDVSKVTDTIQGGSFYFTTSDQYKWYCDIPWYDPDGPIVDITNLAFRGDDSTIDFSTHAAVDSIEVVAILISQHADAGEHNIYLNSDINTVPATNTATMIYATLAPIETNMFEVKTNGDTFVGGDLTVGAAWGNAGLNITEPVKYTLTYRQCTTGSYTRCYRLGQIVFLSFNINVTTSTSNYDYITGLPPALEGGWAGSSGMGAAGMIRWQVTAGGTLRSDGAPTTGWHNGNIVYLYDKYSL